MQALDARVCKPTILVVDEDEHSVALISEELAPHFNVEWARDGRTAIQALLRRTPDAVFLDHALPDGSGIELIDEIRKAQCDCPIVMLTTSDDVRVSAAAMRAGAIDFIVKDRSEVFFEDVVPAATRAVDKWSKEKELEYFREQEKEQSLRTSRLNDALKHKNVQLERAYQDIEASHLQLRRKNERLSELYETAHRFVDNVSHEMRTPLTVIKEFISIVLDGLAGEVNEQQTEYLSIAMSKTNDLARMVDDMLDISKIEAGLLRVDRAPCHVKDILNAAREDLRQKVASRNNQLLIAFEEDLPHIYCDPQQIGRVLINLVVNATKFSKQGTAIRVWARRDADPTTVRIGVSDQGPGIAPEHLEVIFQRFRQVGEGVRSSTKGFGLGLNIVKELVQLNIGHVDVESEVGKGSTFSFTVPVFDPRSLIALFLQRRNQFDCGEDHVCFIRGFSPHVTTSMSTEIKSFLSHCLSPFDLLFERPLNNDVILVAGTEEPQALIDRLRVKEELRMSPGCTVELSFELLENWDPGQSEEQIIDRFVLLFDAELMEKV